MDLVLRALAIYVVILVFTRVLGRRELSTLQPFDLILLIVIGDLIQQGVTQNDLSVTGALVVIATIGMAQVATSIVLVDNGNVIDRNLRRERLTMDDLTEQARKSEIDSLDEVKWAVLETNGEISFIKQQ